MQEYEELCHKNQINEDTSSVEGKLLPSTSSSFQEFQQYYMHLCCLTSASITGELDTISRLVWTEGQATEIHLHGFVTSERT